MVTEKKNQYKSFGIFPPHFLWIGLVLFVIGLLSSYFYFRVGKPEFFNSPVFAIFTSYTKTRFFVVAQTNLLDEIGAIFCLLGLLFMGFSKIKKESEEINKMRISSFFDALITTIICWVSIFLFVYGWPIFIISFFIFYLFLTLYFIIFRIRIWKYNSIAYKSFNKKIDL
jgi:hypothetical protein